VIEAINLGCVRGDRRLFTNLNFSAGSGEIIEVRGPNGSGKTSLLRILCGLAPPAEGEIRWNGTNIRSLGEEYFGAIEYLAHQNGVKDELSALENLRISSGVAGNTLSKRETQTILERVGLKSYQHLPARLLSAGQRRRLALARLLSSNAALWFLDEVLTSLDDDAVRMSRAFINDHLKNGGIAIIATHQDLDIATGSQKRIELSRSDADGMSALPAA
jgi:heme exporter protein A